MLAVFFFGVTILATHQVFGQEKTIFSISVNYDLSVESLVAQGKYDWKSSYITSKNFSTTRKGEATLNLELVPLNQVLTSEEVIAELKKQGLRPAELHELLAFGAKYPDEQKKYLIVALGSVWRDWSGDRGVAYLYGGCDERGLSLHFFVRRWSVYRRFLAVRI